jgi:hypothetical protein
VDVTKSIEPKSDQMNAEDLLGGPRTFTITEVREGSPEQPVWVYLAEFPQGRPFKPSKTVRRMMAVAWGMDTDLWVGKRITLYCDPDIMFGGVKMGGIRVSHMSGIPGQLSIALTVTRGRRAQFVINRLADQVHRTSGPAPLDQLVAAFTEARIVDAAERLQYCSDIVQRPLKSAADLTVDEVAMVIGALQPVHASEPELSAAERGAELLADVPAASGDPSEAELAAIADREAGA